MSIRAAFIYFEMLGEQGFSRLNVADYPGRRVWMEVISAYRKRNREDEAVGRTSGNGFAEQPDHLSC
jgi:hypothetical protein